jgi:hypothetical protein
MSKKILHFQIPIDKYGSTLTSAETIIFTLNKIEKIIPKYYKVIASPFKITIDKKTITIDTSNLKDISNEKEWLELITNMIEKEGYIVKLIK